MTLPADIEIYKDTLLESYQQAMDEGHLELSIKPALDALNSIPGIVTVGSCEGHPERDVFCATVDLHVNSIWWKRLQENIDELLPPEGGIAHVQFDYHSGEEGVQKSVRVRTHPALVQEKAVPALVALAKRMQVLVPDDIVYFESSTCPYCYERYTRDPSRGGVYELFAITSTPGVYRCPHCKHAFVKELGQPTPIRVVEY